MRNVQPIMQRRTPLTLERPGSEQTTRKRLLLLAIALPALLFAGVAGAQYGQYPPYGQPPPYGQYPQYGQYPMLDAAANRVVQKYQYSSCDQLWQERAQPRSQREDEAVRFLRENPQMRAMFIDRVAAPVANKMFECGMIP